MRMGLSRYRFMLRIVCRGRRGSTFKSGKVVCFYFFLDLSIVLRGKCRYINERKLFVRNYLIIAHRTKPYLKIN